MNKQSEFPILDAYFEARIEKIKSNYLGLMIATPAIMAVIFAIFHV